MTTPLDVLPTNFNPGNRELILSSRDTAESKTSEAHAVKVLSVSVLVHFGDLLD